jgi:hypothetical protein
LSDQWGHQRNKGEGIKKFLESNENETQCTRTFRKAVLRGTFIAPIFKKKEKTEITNN